jgi:hypothetical protein
MLSLPPLYSQKPAPNSHRCGIIILCIWTFINLLQALFTELHFDEAYYKLFADHLDWGYFDHPPAVAFLAWLGTALFSGGLGIRLGTVLLHPFSLYLFWKSLPSERQTHLPFFLLIAAAIPYIQITGFVLTPDAPLFFSMALLLFAFQKFNKRAGWGEMLLLALALACAMYSKYHAVLFIVLLIIAQPKLLRQPKFYLVVLLAIALYFPHLRWESQHDWVSLRYHLFDRSRDLRWSNVLEFFWNIPASYNPLIFIPFIWFSVHNRLKDAYDRLLHYTAIGFVVFFTATTLRGHVQPQWVFPIVFYMIWTLYQTGLSQPKAGKWIQRLALVSVGILFLIRILLVCNLPIASPLGFSQNKKAYAQLAEAVEGKPLIFDSNYGMAAHYTYYSGQPAHSPGWVYHRNSQFGLWKFDEAFYGQQVWVHCPDSLPQWKLPNGKAVSLKKQDFYIPLSKIEVSTGPLPRSHYAGNPMSIALSIHNPYDFPLPIGSEIGLRAIWKNREGVLIDVNLPLPDSLLAPGARLSIPASLPTPSQTGYYELGFALQREPLRYQFAHRPVKLHLSEQKKR